MATAILAVFVASAGGENLQRTCGERGTGGGTMLRPQPGSICTMRRMGPNTRSSGLPSRCVTYSIREWGLAHAHLDLDEATIILVVLQ